MNYSSGRTIFFVTLVLMLGFIAVGKKSRGEATPITEEVKAIEGSNESIIVVANTASIEKKEVMLPVVEKTIEGPDDTPVVTAQPVEQSRVEPAFTVLLPTDNREIFGDPSRFFMYTNRYIDDVNTRPWQGGKYGFVRNQLSTQIGVIYTRIHEGIDIRPVKRDRNDVPLDDVRSMSDGTVVYVNSSPSRSNYGKYVVVKHDWPEGSFYSLYAHLASTDVTADQTVKAGEKLGVLGYTGDGIDRERAHVHVELNFLLSERFDTDYSAGNGHKNYNGINLVGIDLARFLRKNRDNPHLSIKDFLADEEPYYKVQTACEKMPGILERHPWLGVDMEKADDARGWEFTFARSGVPLAISPCERTTRYPVVSWVKTVNTNHSYMTMGRLSGSGSKASLSSRGGRYIALISEAF